MILLVVPASWGWANAGTLTTGAQGYGVGTYLGISKINVPRSPGQYPWLYLGCHKIQNWIPGQVPPIPMKWGTGVTIDNHITFVHCVVLQVYGPSSHRFSQLHDSHGLRRRTDRTQALTSLAQSHNFVLSPPGSVWIKIVCRSLVLLTLPDTIYGRISNEVVRYL